MTGTPKPAGTRAASEGKRRKQVLEAVRIAAETLVIRRQFAARAMFARALGISFEAA
jgi:hypothetical protein